MDEQTKQFLPILYFFEDYSRNCHKTNVGWVAIGLGITLGTILSIIPQIYVIIKNRSGFGLSYSTIFLTSFGQFSLVVNVLCFNANLFIGICQFDLSKSFAAYITFANLFLLWFCYLFIVFVKLIFVSKKENKCLVAIAISFTFFSSLILLLIFYSIGIQYGFHSLELKKYGTLLGMCASVLVYVQYLPQIITTFNMKRIGSLSLLTLEIQAPGGIINALFMWIGQGQHWSTWISVLLAAIQQFILLTICCYYSHYDLLNSQTRLNALIPARSSNYFEKLQTSQLPDQQRNQLSDHCLEISLEMENSQTL